MRSNEEIIELMNQLKNEKNISISELARRVGMAKSAISRYFNFQREFPLNRANDFAKALGVEPDYLLGIDFKMPKNAVFVDSVVNIPIIGNIAAGTPILAEQNIEGNITMLPQNVPTGKLIALNIKGDSMYPTIPNGSQVLVRLQEEVENGEIAAVLLPSEISDEYEATLKRVKKQGDITMLIPDNKDYEPIIVNEDSSAYIVGKAVQVIYDL
ncbi:helix-turn-helix domain-containing protein [Enterococcus cecorum]|nr:helix-turn-helix domain-containing protein [Enterococcus cecorum]